MSLLYIIRLFELFFFFFLQLGKEYLKFLLQKSHLAMMATLQADIVWWTNDNNGLCTTKVPISTDLRAHLGCMHPTFTGQHFSLKVQNIYQLKSQLKAFIYNQKFNKLLICYRVNTSSAAEQSMFNIQDLSAMLPCPLH